uniref:Sperm associated antigen 1 n=1 Tax=Poecilia reticulata TaxID=8081 RepID=A0A3P9Q9W2_POERE
FTANDKISAAGFSTKVPVEHLDYDFIEKCKDVKYLEKILRILRSGEEGIYPHLIKFCERHLEKLNPNSRALRKENPVATEANFSKDDVFLLQTSLPKQTRNPSKRVVPRDYQEWDKFNVEEECGKVDGSMQRNDPPAQLNSGHLSIRREVDASLLSHQEKLLLANREKDKGNEAFRANDYEEAVAYYSRSLSIFPTVNAYNNRAQAEIRLEHWHNAMTDCLQVLELEPRNKKALLRRATVYYHMGKFQMASEDLRTVLQEEPNNPAAMQLLSKIEKKMSDCPPEQQSKGKKILIEEMEEDLCCSKEEQEEQRGETQLSVYLISRLTHRLRRERK